MMLVGLLPIIVTAFAAGIAFVPGAMPAVIILASTLILLALTFRREPGLQLLLVSALLVRAGAAIVHTFLFPLPDSQADALVFEAQAAVWANDGWNMSVHHFALGSATYPWLLSVLYLAIGRSVLAAQAVSVILGTLIVLNVYWLAERNFCKSHALRLGWLAALFPSLILYSAITMREVFVVYPLTLGLLFFSSWLVERGWLRFSLGVLCFVVSGTFHLAVLMCLLVLVAILWLAKIGRDIRHRATLSLSVNLVVGLLILPVAAWATLNYQTEYGRLTDILKNLPTLLAAIQGTAAAHAEGRLAYLQDTLIAGPGDLLRAMPIRAAYFFASPFPWEIRAPQDIVLSIDGMLYIILLPVTLFVLIKRRSSVPVWPATVVTATLVIVFSFGSSNSGTAFRHRAKLAPILISASVPLAIVFPRRRRLKSKLPYSNDILPDANYATFPEGTARASVGAGEA